MPLARALVVAVLTIAAYLFSRASAQAATCSQFSNQAAAQRAHSTRDADGDGLYCETLPCPCLGARRHASPPAHAPVARLGLSKSVGAPRSKGRGCKLRGPLPDARCTPGAVYLASTPRLFCVSGYSARIRDVSEDTKRAVYAEYGISSHREGQYEVDHLVPLELGGSNSIANLFPEPARPRPGFHDKDRLEDAAHARACRQQASFRFLQRRMAKNWIQLYGSLVGKLPR